MNSFNDNTECSEMNGANIENLNGNIERTAKPTSNIKKKIKTAKIVLFAALAVIVVLLVFIGLFIFRTINDPQAAFEKPVIGEIKPGDPVNNANNAAAVNNTKANTVNILVMGMDIDEERASTSRDDFRADTILLVNVDFTDKKINMVTVPRDSYAYVKNAAGKFFKINSAVYFGGGIKDSGFKNACETISVLFGGIEIDYYAVLDMPGLVKLVDTIGGVNYNVDVPVNYYGFRIKEGYQKLNGEQVLTYCRVRKGIGTDVDRQGRQYKMMMAILKQLKSTDQLTKIPQIYQSIDDMLYTNLSFEQICALTVLATNIDLDKDINRYVLEGDYGSAYGHQMYLIDQKKKVELVKKIFGIDIPEDKEHDIYFVLEDSKNKPKQ